MADCPYELYWYHKSNGWEATRTYNAYSKKESDHIQVNLTLTEIFFSLNVASDYAVSAGNGKYYIYQIDKEKISKAHIAKANAETIIKKYESLDDYKKLYAYLREICELVSYDFEAAKNPSELTVNRHTQLVSVFDEDNNTNVVCEGYSKAFAYLCEKSNFQNDIKCYIVTSKNHMWNIVTMEDGKNYIVDVTNCDENTIGSPNQLFLAGAKGNVDNGYVFVNKNGKQHEYIYEDITKQIFPKSILEISDTAYRQEEESINQPKSDYIDKTVIFGNLKYKIISTNNVISAQFFGVKKKVKTVIIPASIRVDEMTYKVTDIANNTMKNDRKIRNLTIGKNIEHIGKNAFRGCKNLKKIITKTRKLTVNKIDNNAFKGINKNVKIVES